MAQRRRNSAKKDVPGRLEVAGNTSQQPQTVTDFNALMNMVNNAMLSRTSLGSRLGMQFDGDRDLYATFGYKRQLTYDDFRDMYDRLGIATRLVDKFSNDTWNKPPILIDGGARSDNVGEKTTPFLTEWNALVKRLKLWQTMREVDVMCGMGRYSIILLGFPGDLASAVTKGEGNTLFYVSAYDEKQAEISSYVQDEKNSSYGLPEYYNVNIQTYEGSTNTTRKQKVHYSRVIHVSENRLGSRVFGRPRMQEVYNRLMDLEKVTGGGAEAAWLAVYMGFLILTREGTELPAEGTEEWRATEEAIQTFAHRIQRFATLKGVEKIENLGVHEVRIKDIYGVLISDLAGSKGIPQRILIGSERGDLASTQDKDEWNGVIDSRRTNFAEPEILDPMVQKCVEMGVIPPPSSGTWTTMWQPVYALSQMQKADYVFKLAQAANMLTASGGTQAIDINEFRGTIDLPAKTPKELAADAADAAAQEAANKASGNLNNPQGIDQTNPQTQVNPQVNPDIPIKDKANGKQPAQP